MELEAEKIREELMKLCGKGVTLSAINQNTNLQIYFKGEITYMGENIWKVEHVLDSVHFHLNSVWKIYTDKIVISV